MDFSKPPYFGPVEMKMFGSALNTAKFIAPEIIQVALDEGHDIENDHYEKVGDCDDPLDNLILATRLAEQVPSYTRAVEYLYELAGFLMGSPTDGSMLPVIKIPSMNEPPPPPPELEYM